MTLRLGEAREVGMSAARIERLRSCAAAWVETGLTQSLAYLVARRGVIVAEEAFGVRHYADPVPLATNSVFALASATKPITATAIMQLVEDGSLSLNRPVVEYLPEVCGKGAHQILVHHLLTHTSGYSMSSAARRLRDTPLAIDDLLDAVYSLDPDGPAGQENRYCGIVNYLFLGEIVRRVGGSDLAQHARDRIFAPLGMTSSSIGLAPALASRRVVPDPAIYVAFPGYDPNEQARLMLPHGGSSGFSTVRDMAVFMQMFLDGGTYDGAEILSPAAVAAMTENQIPGVGARDGAGRWISEASWGLGFGVQGAARWQRAHGTLQPRGTFYHQGASGAAVFADPASQTQGIFLSVIRRIDATDEFFWEFDRFQNLVMAAVGRD